MITLALIPAMTGMALAAFDPTLAGRGLLQRDVDAVCIVSAGGLVFLVEQVVSRHEGRARPRRREG